MHAATGGWCRTETRLAESVDCGLVQNSLYIDSLNVDKDVLPD
jgi:hypothetical protein